MIEPSLKIQALEDAGDQALVEHIRHSCGLVCSAHWYERSRARPEQGSGEIDGYPFGEGFNQAEQTAFGTYQLLLRNGERCDAKIGVMRNRPQHFVWQTSRGVLEESEVAAWQRVVTSPQDLQQLMRECESRAMNTKDREEYRAIQHAISRLAEWLDPLIQGGKARYIHNTAISAAELTDDDERAAMLRAKYGLPCSPNWKTRSRLVSKGPVPIPGRPFAEGYPPSLDGGTFELILESGRKVHAYLSGFVEEPTWRQTGRHGVFRESSVAAWRRVE